jgi:hypothetical protein
MEFRITFGILDGEYDGPVVDVAQVEDASAEAADEAHQLDPAATVSVQPGSTGKGAAGPGIDLVLHVVEEVLNDGASVFAWGTVLWGIIRLVRRRGNRRVQSQDPKTLGFLTASAKPDHESRLAGAKLVTTVCLTGGGPDIGTDLRDVWATSFLLPSGDAWVLFSAPNGGILGEVTVPARWTPGRGEISGEEVARTYASLNIDRTFLGLSSSQSSGVHEAGWRGTRCTGATATASAGIQDMAALSRFLELTTSTSWHGNVQPYKSHEGLDRDWSEVGRSRLVICRQWCIAHSARENICSCMTLSGCLPTPRWLGQFSSRCSVRVAQQRMRRLRRP